METIKVTLINGGIINIKHKHEQHLLPIFKKRQILISLLLKEY